jgi:hypothetical protein
VDKISETRTIKAIHGTAGIKIKTGTEIGVKIRIRGKIRIPAIEALDSAPKLETSMPSPWRLVQVLRK